MMPDLHVMYLVQDRDQKATEWERNARHLTELEMMNPTTEPVERRSLRSRIGRLFSFGRVRRLEASA